MKVSVKKIAKTAATKKPTRRKQDVFLATVLDFYEKYGRHDLPWRKAITPYKILVSEVMLQQTQVGRVIPKYKSWLKKYPTLTKLSVASLSEVLILWQGLGYQRRAKALLSVAKMRSALPKKYDELRALPGIGEYTASAIIAFAYDRFDNPVVETNIRTALIEHFYKNKVEVGDEVLKELLMSLSKDGRVISLGARHFYYALMDYGAHLKSKKISHNAKSTTYKKQTRFKGSQRELRAKVLFAITHQKELPKDERLEVVVRELLKEGFIHETKPSCYQVV